MKDKYIVLMIALITGIQVQAQTLIKDINPGNGKGDPVNYVQMGNNIYFIANDGTHGYELWKTDGTTLGTNMVLDINSGSDNSMVYIYAGFYYYFTPLIVMNNNIYFTANDGSNGFELWKSDGTASGTAIVKDINPGSGDGFNDNYFELMSNGSYLYFSANDGNTGYELWKSDGTSNGTVLLKNINPGSSSSYPTYFFADGNIVYFSANDGTNNVELWKTDGTTGGTAMLKDINPSVNGYSSPTGFIKAGNKIYFTANDGSQGVELWVTDGTESGTSIVRDINLSSGSYPFQMTVLNDNLLFQASDGTNGYELWSSDGTYNGTILLKNIYPGNSSGIPEFMTVFKNKVYFAADDGTHGVELWVTDGTTLGTSLFLDINNVSNQPSTPSQLYVTPFGLYFNADDGTNGQEPWVTDGTISGTHIIGQICPSSCSSYPQHFFRAGNNLFFTAYESNTNFELYKIDLPTDINDLSNDFNFNIFPNPSSDELNISLSKNIDKKIGITIKNLAGQTVYTQFINSGNISINISLLTSGMYFLNMTDGNSTMVKKFVKE